MIVKPLERLSTLHGSWFLLARQVNVNIKRPDTTTQGPEMSSVIPISAFYFAVQRGDGLISVKVRI